MKGLAEHTQKQAWKLDNTKKATAERSLLSVSQRETALAIRPAPKQLRLLAFAVLRLCYGARCFTRCALTRFAGVRSLLSVSQRETALAIRTAPGQLRLLAFAGLRLCFGARCDTRCAGRASLVNAACFRSRNTRRRAKRGTTRA